MHLAPFVARLCTYGAAARGGEAVMPKGRPRAKRRGLDRHGGHATPIAPARRAATLRKAAGADPKARPRPCPALHPAGWSYKVVIVGVNPGVRTVLGPRTVASGGRVDICQHAGTITAKRGPERAGRGICKWASTVPQSRRASNGFGSRGLTLFAPQQSIGGPPRRQSSAKCSRPTRFSVTARWDAARSARAPLGGIGRPPTFS